LPAPGTFFFCCKKFIFLFLRDSKFPENLHRFTHMRANVCACAGVPLTCTRGCTHTNLFGLLDCFFLMHVFSIASYPSCFQHSKAYFFFSKSFCGPCLQFYSFKTQTMHLKSFYTHCYVSLKHLFPGEIRTRVLISLRRMRCPLRHAASASS
jgi:hypothetical protein